MGMGIVMGIAGGVGVSGPKTLWTAGGSFWI